MNEGRPKASVLAADIFEFGGEDFLNDLARKGAPTLGFRQLRRSNENASRLLRTPATTRTTG